MAADPVVSPADTIRAIVERSAVRGYTAWKDEDRGCEVVSLETHEALVEDYMALGDAAAALLAVGERDRRQIAQLTEALEQIEAIRVEWDNCDSHDGFDFVEALWRALGIARAVLAGEEDAEAVPPHSFGEQGIRPEPNHTWPPRAASEGDTRP